MIDVSKNRRSAKYTVGQQTARVFWALAWPLFALSPRPFWGWRRSILRLFGADVAKGVHVYSSAQITMPWNVSIGEDAAVGAGARVYALGRITIGPRTTVSQGAHLCAGTHDWRKPDRPLVTPPIHLKSDVWVCADAFVGPGVTVGENAILGARSVVMRDVASCEIVAGNPARVVGRTDEAR